MTNDYLTHRLRIYKTGDSILNFNPDKKVINHIPKIKPIYLSKELPKFRNPKYISDELNLKAIRKTFIKSNKYGHNKYHLTYSIITKQNSQFASFNTLHTPKVLPEGSHFTTYQ